MSAKIKRILLMGNPNVGKSVIFSRLTGVHVTISNYPGTTIEYAKGYMLVDGVKTEVIDIPGTYSLSPTSKAEDVAVKMIREGDMIINIVDATNLERNLGLTLELAERGLPIVIALNMWDETAHRGIEIDASGLSERLNIPVVPTVAVTGEGVKKLASKLCRAKPAAIQQRTDEERWKTIGEIVNNSQKLHHHHHTFLQRLEDVALRPVTGIGLAAVVLFISFFITRFIGEGLINFILDPIFNNVLLPLLSKLSTTIGPGTMLHEILIGKLIDGSINFKESMGILTTGIYIPIAAVLPYILSFYLVLGFLEDVGYLPRVAVLLDRLMHKMGLHGYAIIPNLLGLGCNVPGIMATRVLESTRERFIASTLISIAIPCAALQAMVIGILGARGIQYVILLYLFLGITWMIIGAVLNKFVTGFSPTLFIEIPPFRWPNAGMFLKKYRMRVIYFLKEAVPILLAGIFVVTILYSLGIFNKIAAFTAPVVKGVWGLPRDAVVAIVIGFLRKDVAVGMLEPLHLTTAQLITACGVLAMFFPCIASFTVLLKELKLKYFTYSVLIMLAAAIFMGGLINLITKFLIG